MSLLGTNVNGVHSLSFIFGSIQRSRSGVDGSPFWYTAVLPYYITTSAAVYSYVFLSSPAFLSYLSLSSLSHRLSDYGSLFYILFSQNQSYAYVRT